MAYENDFVPAPTEIDIGGRKFKIKILSGGDYDEVLSEFLTIRDRVLTINTPQRNESLLRECVIDAPTEYGVNGKAFKDLTKEERIKRIQSLKPKIRTALLIHVMDLNEMPDFVKKKSETPSSEENTQTQK